MLPFVLDGFLDLCNDFVAGLSSSGKIVDPPCHNDTGIDVILSVVFELFDASL
jgi:hypothetical protein